MFSFIRSLFIFFFPHSNSTWGVIISFFTLFYNLCVCLSINLYTSLMWAWLVNGGSPAWVICGMDDETTTLVSHQQPGSRGCLRKDYCPCIPARYVLALMTCFGLTVVYGLRVNLSVAIVQMDNDTATVPHSGSAMVTYGLVELAI